MKTLFVRIAGWEFVNIVRRNNTGGYDSDYNTFATPGGGRKTKVELETWALIYHQDVRYWYV